MGIENFFNTLTKSNFIEKLYLDKLESKLETQYLYIDFNSVIYTIVEDFEYDINYYLYSIIIKNKDEYCETIEKKYSINFEDIDSFSNYFKQETVDELIKESIYNFIKNLCIKVNKYTLREIYISFDGTPTFSKISEQKKRKYLNCIISDFKKEIYENYKEKIDKDRELFYSKKISFGVNRPNKYCGNWSGHIQDIYNNLSSFQFKIEMYELCPNLKELIISSAYEFGEGEKKITEHIMQNKKSGKYIIYSPDSDTILLSIIINNKFKRLNIDTDINILKHDSNENKIELISILKLIDNIYEYVYTKLNPFRKHNHDKLNIIDDLIGLITFFGNDFLPKIESLNMKNGFEILLTTYAKNLSYCRLKNPYLLYTENNKTKINMYVFTDLINKLSELEDKLLFDKYISSEFKNFNYLLRIFGNNEHTPFFIDKLNRYCHGFNKVVRYIKLNPDKTSEEIYRNIIEKFSDKNDWERIFNDIENKDKQYGEINTNDILNIIIESVKENKKYKLGLKLVKNSENVLDKFHQINIKEDLEHPMMNINDYDIEIYKLEKKMDEYKNISLEPEEKIGLVDLKYKDNEYKIHTDRNITIKKDYFYKEILKLNEDEINNLSEEYIKGFFWTIDFYFNKIERNININNISIWSYKYSHTPYFKEINKYIDNYNNILNELYKSISDISSEYYVSPSQYINSLEQYLYITPKHILKNNIPDIYKEILNDSNLFIEIEKFYEEIKSGNITLLESYDSKTITKLNITGFKKSSYYDFMSKILPLRKLNEYEPII